MSGVSRHGVTLSVLATGDECTSPALMLTAERIAAYGGERRVLRRVLINVPEGLRRLCNEYGVKLKTVSAAYVTRLAPEVCMGLPSLVFHLADAGTASLRVVGPEGTAEFWETCRRFVSRKYPSVEVQHAAEWRKLCVGCDPHDLRRAVVDDPFLVTPIVVDFVPREEDSSADGEPRGRQEGGGDGSGEGEGDSGRAAKREGQGVLGDRDAKRSRKAGSRPAQCAQVVCYLITVACDTTTQSVLVVDCPDMSWVPSLQASVLLAETAKSDDVGIVVHLTGAKEFESSKYKGFVAASFSPAVKHAVVRRQDDGILFRSSAVLQNDLATKAPGMYHPVALTTRRKQTRIPTVTDEPVSLGMAETVQLLLNDDDTIAGTSMIERKEGDDDGANDSASVPAVTVSADAGSSTNAGPELCVLGTGAAAPSKLRGCTCIHVKQPTEELPLSGVLLDCGEGATAALDRRYGNSSGSPLLQLSLVWLSHLHADHHGGLPILMRRRLLDWLNHAEGGLLSEAPFLPIVAPLPVCKVLESFERVFRTSGFPLAPFLLIDCVTFNNPANAVRQLVLLGTPGSDPGTRCGLTYLESVPVYHCRDAFGVCLAFGSGLRVAFSGDTRPCPTFAESAKGAHVLIHEATFDDGRSEEASRKRHSTVSEALSISRIVAPRITILTHFSQRYPELPPTDRADAVAPGESVVLSAADGMTVPLDHSEWAKLPKLAAALATTLKSRHQDDDVKG